MGFKNRLAHAWNAFSGQPTSDSNLYGGAVSYGSGRPDRTRLTMIGDKSIITSIYNRIAIDVAAVKMLHVRLDDDERYQETIKSGLNYCMTVEANIDQAARSFKQDIIMTMLDKGVVAVVPVDTTLDPNLTSAYDIQTMRVGEIVAWFPQHIRVRLYNDETGRKEEVTVAKKNVAIIENPLYAVMNETNSTLQRLLRKLGLLDTADEASASGKLDLIIQLPYVIKSEARKQQADQRRKDIEFQLSGSKYGIAYTDGTERITQLNRPAENNMLKHVELLTEQLYSQLGLTKEVFDGTASEAVMLNYYNRTVEPLLTAVAEAFKRSFLSKTARSQGHSVEFYRDPFRLVPMSAIGDLADKFIRNQVFTSNEIRTAVGWKPSKDPKADKLGNPNMPEQKQISSSTQPQAQPLQLQKPSAKQAIETILKNSSSSSN